MSRKPWAERFTKLAVGTQDRWQRIIRLSLAAAPLVAGLLLGGVTQADQSVLVKSPSTSETSATSIATQPAQPLPAASEQVSTEFQKSEKSLSDRSSTDQGTIKLKWRARHPNSFAVSSTKHDPAVRQATQMTELNNANPFNDPFEDRTRSQFTSTQQDSAGGAFRERGQAEADSGQPSTRPQFRQPLSNDDSLLSPTRDGCTDCPDKCYKGRNCCDELKNCSTARQLIRDYDIKSISLDISPSIKPDAETPEELEEYKNQQLFQASSRTWRDADGKVLVEGSMVDYSNNRVYIATDSGETKKYAYRQLSDDDRCFVAAWWNIPAACKLGNEKFEGRYHQPVTMTWTASQVCHKPLYFEEIALERYGHTAGPIVQPWLSGAHFFKNIAVLPYKVGINPLGECQYDLGYYRPGNCAPWLLSPVPISPRGALFQAGAVTGVSYLIP